MDVHKTLVDYKNQLEGITDSNSRAEVLLEMLKFDVDSGDFIPGQKKQDYINELVALSDQLNNDHLRAWSQFFLGRLSGNAEVLLVAAELFGQLKLYSEQGKVYLAVGIALRKSGKSVEALEFYQKALEITDGSNEHKLIARLYNSMANIYEDIGNLSEAISLHLKSLKLREDINDWLGEAISYNNIGKVYNLNSNFKEASKYLLKGLRIIDKKGQHHIALAIVGNLSNSYFLLKNYDEAIKISKIGLRIIKDFPDVDSSAYLLNTLGNVYYEKGELTVALKYYTEANNHAEEIERAEIIAGTLNSLGNCHMMLGDNKKALFYLKKALVLATKTDIKDILKWNHLNLYDLYKRMGKYALSLSHYEKHVELEREIQNEETTKKIASMQFGYQIDKKEQEVTLEREKKEEIEKAYNLLDLEKQRSESLLLNILPEEVAHELKEKGSAEAKLFKNVTVLFTDFKGFTTLSEKMSPKELVSEIHECFKAFDEIIGKYSIEKIKTVGDAYLAVSGLPIANDNHANDVVKAAIEIRDFMLTRRKQLGDKTFELRIGINSGEAIAGIVGVKKYAYDIWGDTVNTAARMEQSCDAGMINISQSTYELVNSAFNCIYRGEFEAKNKGLLKMYYIND